MSEASIHPADAELDADADLDDADGVRCECGEIHDSTAEGLGAEFLQFVEVYGLNHPMVSATIVQGLRQSGVDLSPYVTDRTGDGALVLNLSRDATNSLVLDLAFPEPARPIYDWEADQVVERTSGDGTTEATSRAREASRWLVRDLLMKVKDFNLHLAAVGEAGARFHPADASVLLQTLDGLGGIVESLTVFQANPLQPETNVDLSLMESAKIAENDSPFDRADAGEFGAKVDALVARARVLSGRLEERLGAHLSAGEDFETARLHALDDLGMVDEGDILSGANNPST